MVLLAAVRPRIAEIIGRNVDPEPTGRLEPDPGYAAVAHIVIDPG
jgi:hypothetical protein